MLPASQWLYNLNNFIGYSREIFNATRCSIITEEIRTLPELHGQVQEKNDTGKLCILVKLPIVANHEIPLMQETSPEEVVLLDEVKSKVVIPSHSFDESLFHIRRTFNAKHAKSVGT